MDRETLARTLDHDANSLAVSRMMSEGKGKEIILDKKRNFYDT